jgi:hypothetical protein
MDIFSYCHFHNASKECLKVPFWQFFNFSKMALLNPCMKFEKKFSQKHSFEAL